ncbi:hypothetical protein B5E82_04225 [Lachnoclostridium sp. An138]|nr:hypothetical protein B5E82_04225 [Lachnoclostridium sp. An138]
MIIHKVSVLSVEVWNGAAVRQGCLAAGCPQRGFVLRYENGREGMTFPGGLFRSGFGFFWLSGKLIF